MLIGRYRGEYEMFLLYLGGHGRAAGRSFEFAFYGQGKEHSAASSSQLDGLLELAGAEHVVLWLDACHAGRYAEESGFFHGPSNRRSRHCVASSTATQKSWEDPHFRRSLFADAIIRSLARSPSQAPEVLSIAGAFFGAVSSDVIRHAFGLKSGIAQEPLIVGASNVDLHIPTGIYSVQPPQAMSTHKALVRRVREVGISVAVAAVIFIGCLSALIWRPAINGSGFLELRPGPKWLSPLNIYAWSVRVEAEATRSDVRDESLDPQVWTDLRNESGVFLWPGSNVAGSRRWADEFVTRYLRPEAEQRWRIRLGYPNAVASLKRAGRAPLPADIVVGAHATRLAAEAKVLRPNEDSAAIWNLQWKHMFTDGECSNRPLSEQATARLGIYLTPGSAPEFVAWIDGLTLLASLDDAIGFQHLFGIARMLTSAYAQWDREYRAVMASDEPLTVARLSTRFDERPTLEEKAAVGRLGRAILERRLATRSDALSPRERDEMLSLMQGCEDVAVRILARLGPYAHPPAVTNWARARPVTSDLGKLALLDLANAKSLPDEEISWVLNTQGFNGTISERKRAFYQNREWLIAVADHQNLPPKVVAALLKYSADRLVDNERAEAFNSLVVALHSPRAFDVELQNDTMHLVEALSASMHPSVPSAGTYELLGLIARSGGPLTQEQRKLLLELGAGDSSDHLARVSFPSPEDDRSGATRLAPGLTMSHLLAFSRFVNTSDESALRNDRTLPFLRQSLTDGFRAGLSIRRLREPIWAAARTHAAQNGRASAIAIREEIAAHAADAAARRTSQEIAAATIHALPQPERDLLSSDLRALWSIEPEPEVKLSLAAVLIGATNAELWQRLRAGRQ